MVSLENYSREIKAKMLTTDSEQKDRLITGGYSSDLLSDVMGNAAEGDCWITIMRHMNVIAVASLAGMSAIVFANNVEPDQAVIDKAREHNICLLSSPLSAFDCAGKLYRMLNPTGGD